MNKFNNIFYNIYENLNQFKKLIIYPGRFHPFHKGHYGTYEYLMNKFPDADIFISSSNKIELPNSPFNFEQKKKLAEHLGVNPDQMIQTKNPYVAFEITQNYNPDNTLLLFAVSKKDMETDPRFAFKPKKDGSPSYFQPYIDSKDLKPLSQHGYIITTPTFTFNVLGKPAKSASEIRNAYINSDESTRLRIIKDLYGSIDKEIIQIWNNALVNNNEVQNEKQ